MLTTAGATRSTTAIVALSSSIISTIFASTALFESEVICKNSSTCKRPVREKARKIPTNAPIRAAMDIPKINAICKEVFFSVIFLHFLMMIFFDALLSVFVFVKAWQALFQMFLHPQIADTQKRIECRQLCQNAED